MTVGRRLFRKKLLQAEKSSVSHGRRLLLLVTQELQLLLALVLGNLLAALFLQITHFFT